MDDFLPTPCAWAVIYLGRRSLHGSSSLPGTYALSRRAGSEQLPVHTRWTSCLLGLAPGGGCLAAGIAARAGGLLQQLQATANDIRLPAYHFHHFTLASEWRTIHLGGMFLWPDRQVAPPRGLPGAVLYGVRTFLDAARLRRDCPTDLGS